MKRIFSNSRENVVGIYHITGEKDNGKFIGNVITEKREPAEKDFDNHEKGKAGLGLSPIMLNNNCTWGAIDVDIYPTKIEVFSKKYSELPLFFCRTKSGGMHIYVFTKKEVKAKSMRAFLFILSKLLKLPQFMIDSGKKEEVEVFPKQTYLKRDQSANWINLPYFNAKKTNRYCIYNGIKLTLEQFIDTVNKKRISSFSDILNKFCMAGAPPCIEKLFSYDILPGHRDISLLNAGVFLKKKYPKLWQSKLATVNSNIGTPLDERELNNVISQLTKKDIFYQCKTEMKGDCDKKKCSLTKYGVNMQNDPDLLIGEMTKVMTKPPIWKIDIAEKTITVDTEELLSQNKFRKKVLEVTDKILPIISLNEWDVLLQDRLDNMIIEDAPKEADINSDFYFIVKEFCIKMSNSREINDILNGKVFLLDNKNLFLAESLKNYLRRKGVTGYKGHKIFELIKNLSGGAINKRINEKVHRLYFVPVYDEQTIVKEKMVPDFGKYDELEIF